MRRAYAWRSRTLFVIPPHFQVRVDTYQFEGCGGQVLNMKGICWGFKKRPPFACCCLDGEALARNTRVCAQPPQRIQYPRAAREIGSNTTSIIFPCRPTGQNWSRAGSRVNNTTDHPHWGRAASINSFTSTWGGRKRASGAMQAGGETQTFNAGGPGDATTGTSGAHLAAQGLEQLGVEAVFPCVKLRGLPFDASEDDVRTFLVRARASLPSPVVGFCFAPRAAAATESWADRSAIA